MIEHSHPLVRKFVQIMHKHKTSFREVSSRTNIGVDTLRFWQGRHVPRVDLLDAALNAIGYELHIRPIRE